MKLPELVYQDESRNNRSCRVGDLQYNSFLLTLAQIK